MILSWGRRFLFLHQPKTGGTSFALAYEARAMKNDILVGDTPKARKRAGRQAGLQTAGRLWKHSTLADIDGLLTKQDLAEMQIVTLVRNPWDRLVSYYHWLKDQSFDHPAIALARGLSFSEFLNHPQTRAGLAANPSSKMVTDAHGHCHPAIFARIEHWQADLAPVWDHLGFELTLPRVNQSDRPADWRRLYSAEDADLVARLCARDIASFGYDLTF